jgi:hypothetical protein
MGYYYNGGIPPKEEIEKAKNEYLADKHIPLPKLNAEKNEISKFITSEGIPVGKPGNQMLYERDNEPIPMSEEMTNRLWELINENTELKQQLYFAEHRLEQIKRLLSE